MKGGSGEFLKFDFKELMTGSNIERVGELNPYVTLACDLRCDYCYMYPFLTTARNTTELMPKRFLIDLVDHFSNAGEGLDRLTFLGGEPTLHPDITDLVNEVSERSVTELRMTTNGVSLHHLDLAGLKPGAFDHVSVSIDGVTEESNDATRGRGTFRRIVDTMYRYLASGVRLSVNYTVTNNNLDSMIDAAEFFGEMGVSIMNFHRASMSGNAYNNPTLIVQAADWIRARDCLFSHLDQNASRYRGMTFRVPYIFLRRPQLMELGYRPIQSNNYHSPRGGHRLIVLPPGERGQGLCYMSSDLIGEPHAELGRIGANGRFRWNSHPDNELNAFNASPGSSNISTTIVGQDHIENDGDLNLVRVSHSFKKTIIC